MTKFGPASLSPLILVLPLLLGACASGGGGKNADGTPKDEESVTTTPLE